MKSIFLPLSKAAVLAATLLLPLALQAPRAQVPAQAPAATAAPMARVIVKYRVGSALMKAAQGLAPAIRKVLQAQTLGRRVGLTLLAGRSVSDRSHVVTAQGLGSAQLAARLGAEADVEYAVVDERKRIVAAPNDPLYPTRAVAASSGGPLVGQWVLRPPGAAVLAAGGTAPAAINAEPAWDLSTGSAAVVVAVLDTGVRFDHVDLLAGNVLAGYDMITSDAVSGDGQAGRDSDAADPGDFVTAAEATAIGSDCAAVPRSSWHGTQTLGLIGAATNNGVGIASVGRNVRVLPVRVLGKCGGFDSDVLAGLRWAAGIAVPGLPANANKARVINMSLGSTGTCSQAYVDAMAEVAAAGTVVVASAGNSAGHAVGTPANCPGVIAIAGLRHVGDKVGFSDLGPEISLSAPGGNCVDTTGGPCQYPITTTSNAGTTTPVAGAAGAIYTDSFNASLGTSFSSPLVAGAAALMLSLQPTLTPADVKAKLQSSARPFPVTGGTAGIAACSAPSGADQLECYCTTTTCGAGMLDVHAALLAVFGAQARIAIDTAVPTATMTVTLSSASVVPAGRTIVAYQWAVASSGGIVTAFSSATNGNSVQIVPSAAGTFSVSLTTTDDLGAVSTATAAVAVAAAPVAATPPVPVAPVAATPASSDSGGGALGAEWLLLLLTAVLALARCRPAVTASRKG